jgi:hypothetical protein
MRAGVDFSESDAQCISFLVDHFDKDSQYVDIDEIPRKTGLAKEEVSRIVDRFSRYGLLHHISRGSVEIMPELLAVAEQLKGDGNHLKYDIFVSYGSQDSGLAQELRAAFESAGMSVFMAEKDIAASSKWKESIREALVSSANVLIVLTPNSIDRNWVLLETGAAWVLQKRIFPALAFVGVDNLVDPLRDVQARRIETSEQREKLIAEIAALHSASASLRR